MVRVDVAAIEADGVQKPQSYTVVIGQGQTVAALEEQFLKMQPGEVAETEIKFPEDHPTRSARYLATGSGHPSRGQTPGIAAAGR